MSVVFTYVCLVIIKRLSFHSKIELTCVSCYHVFMYPVRNQHPTVTSTAAAAAATAGSLLFCITDYTQAYCEAGAHWLWYAGVCYTMKYTESSVAATTCQAEGMPKLVMNSAAEETFVRQASSIYQPARSVNYWRNLGA